MFKPYNETNENNNAIFTSDKNNINIYTTMNYNC